MQVLVHNNNLERAIRILKKKLQREGVFREVKLRSHYEKPSERRVREKGESVRRQRKLQRKRAQKDGLLPMRKPSATKGGYGNRTGGPGRPEGDRMAPAFNNSDGLQKVSPS